MKKVLLIIVLGLMSCTAVRVSYDYDKDTTFSNYSTYHYYYNIDTGLSDLDNRRLFKAIDSILLLKGLLLSEEPDFFVNVTSRSYVAPQPNSVGLGVGGTGGNIGGGLSIGLPIGGAKEEIEIQFDLIDSQKEELFWQAISSSSYREEGTPEAREQQLQKIVDKVFSKYPPK